MPIDADAKNTPIDPTQTGSVTAIMTKLDGTFVERVTFHTLG